MSKMWGGSVKVPRKKVKKEKNIKKNENKNYFDKFKGGR